MAEFDPLFIFGVARSGTNLLARSISSHPQAVVALDPLMPLLKAWRNLTAKPVAQALNYSFDCQSPFQDFYFETAGITFLDAMLNASSELPIDLNINLKTSICERAALEDPNLGNALKELKGSTVKQIFSSALEIIADYAEQETKNRLSWAGLKEVWSVDFVNSLAQAFPTAKFIIIHRDPRAVVSSLVSLMSQDTSQAAHTISYMRHWRKQVSVTYHLATSTNLSQRLLSLRYEDLVADPITWYTKIGAFLNLDDPCCMLSWLHSGKWQGNSSFGVNIGINPNAAKQWRDHLPLALQATVEFHCAPEMAMLGYMCSATKDVRLSAVWDNILEVNQNPGNWRSDSGDVEQDFTWELKRWSILNNRSTNIQEIRQCFLFESTYKKLLEINASALYNDCKLIL